MGREVRRVPADWQHPKDESGRYIGLLDGNYTISAAEWDASRAQWVLGLRENYGEGPKWSPIKPEYAHMRYTDYAGQRPSPDDYMPSWTADEATHLMMYETTSEGTPISPAFATPEELAHWLADNNASAFGDSTASYEAWLRVAQGKHRKPGLSAALKRFPPNKEQQMQKDHLVGGDGGGVQRPALVVAELLAELRAVEAHLHAYVEAIEYGGGSASKSADRLASVRATIAKATGAKP